MDIPVSRLNQRMALQLPAEFPLGLVFVVGMVDELDEEEEDSNLHGFFLIESDHRVRCLLSKRAATETSFNEGDKIRASGHLAFDPHKADYYLFARDVELAHPQTKRLTSKTRDEIMIFSSSFYLTSISNLILPTIPIC